MFAEKMVLEDNEEFDRLIFGIGMPILRIGTVRIGEFGESVPPRVHLLATRSVSLTT